MTNAEGAKIFDQGYRRYSGERTGVKGAVLTVVKHSVKRTLGLGRPARFKVIPVLVIAITVIPGIVFVGIGALFDNAITDELIPTYAEYYGIISISMLMFSAFVAPDLLCTDRRSGMLGVYLSSPLSRPTYLISKAIAVTALLGILTIGAPMLLLFARTIAGGGPDSFGDFFLVILRILASGFVIAALYALVSLAASATTDRVGAAIAITLGVLFGSGIVSNLLVEDADLDTKFNLANLLSLPVELSFRIHGEPGAWRPSDISTLLMTGTYVGIVVACAGFIWFRYRDLLVRR